MAESPRLKDLTEEQQAKFLAVMEKLEKLDVPELLAESARLRLPEPMTEELKPRLRRRRRGTSCRLRIVPSWRTTLRYGTTTST